MMPSLKWVRIAALCLAMAGPAQSMADQGQDKNVKPQDPVAALADFDTTRPTFGANSIEIQSVPYLLAVLDETQKFTLRSKDYLDRYTVFSEYLYNRIDHDLAPTDGASIQFTHRNELSNFFRKLARLRRKFGQVGILVEFKNLPVALSIELQESNDWYEVRAFRPKDLTSIPAECHSRVPSSSKLRLEKCYLDQSLYEAGGFGTETTDNFIGDLGLWRRVSTSLKLAMLQTLTAKELNVDWDQIDQTYVSLKKKPFSEIVSMWVRRIQAVPPRDTTNP